jgi:hypothetical protein
MLKYKVGDRVVLNVEYDDIPPGTLGTVVSVLTDGPYPYRVRYDKYEYRRPLTLEKEIDLYVEPPVEQIKKKNKFEHKVITKSSQLGGVDLDCFNEDGWEMFFCIEHQHNFTYYFKRPVQ